MNASFSPDERCLIGVSGGRDSVALLHQLRAAGFRDLVVCHLDHALRAQSADDAAFVARLAKKWKYPSAIDRVDVASRARKKKLSLETAAREARYSFFAQVAREQKCPRLFLAHHADDQVETFLFNLFRGSSSSGLTGMAPLTSRTIDGVELQVSRPLLGVWREEIEAYIAAHRLAFREDESNTDPRFTRNRLRHEIIPALERAFGRDIRRAIWRTAEILRAEVEFLDRALGPEDPPAEFKVRDLQAEPLALQRRRLHVWLKARGVPNVGFTEVEAVRGLLGGRTAKANLPGRWHARRKAGKLFLEPPR